MSSGNSSKDYLSGVPELLILRLLADTEMYGYEIVKGIRLRSREVMTFGEGVIYPLLHAMQNRRLLSARKEHVNGRPRVYYRLTRRGRRRLEVKVSEWTRVSEAIQQFVEGQSGDPFPAQ